MRGSGGGGASGAGVQRKGAQKGTLTSGADVPIGLFLSGVLDARDWKKYGRISGVLFHWKDRGDWGLVLSSHDRNGGSYNGMIGAGKWKSCRDGGGLIFPLLSAEKQSEEHR